MRYPVLTLKDENNTFLYAEYKNDIEKGAFISINENERKIKIKVDRFSIIPFYYIVINKKLYGSTKFDNIISTLPNDFNKELNIEAAIEFIRTNTMIAEKTLIKGIKRIRYGHELIFDKSSGSYSEKEYWKLPGDISSNTEQQLLEKLEDTFLYVLSENIKSYERIGIHLSGGMDSRNILGGLLKLNTPFKTYTYGVKENIDVKVAKILSKRLSLESKFFEWDGVNSFKENSDLHFNLTDGMQSLIHGHGIEIHADEADNVDTILYGHFLDFFIQGHIYNPIFETDKDIDEHLYRLFNGGPCSIMSEKIAESQMLETEYYGMFRSSIEHEIKKFDYMIPEKRYDSLYFIHHGLRRLMPQMQSGAQFLDFRLPALHDDYFSVAWSVPGAIRKDRKLQEKLLLKLNRKMMDYPIVKDNNEITYMGDKTLKKTIYQIKSRIKHSRLKFLFNEYDYYSSGIHDLANIQLFYFIKKEVLSSALENYGFIKKDYIEKLFSEDKFSTHIANYSTFYTLSKFINKYIK